MSRSMEPVIVDFFDRNLPPPTLIPTHAPLFGLVDAIATGVKACLPRRVSEPTGPAMLLLDMLLSLFVSKGACKSVIDRLPLEVVGMSDACFVGPVCAGDKCAICLATYERGDAVRHLGCSHAFHAECVDMWLEKKSLCPICKKDAC